MKRHPVWSALAIAAGVLLVVLQCARSPAGVPLTELSSAAADAAARCVLGVRGVAVEARDTPAGVDLTFIASPASVAEIQIRARDIAALNGPGAHKGLGHRGHHLGAQQHGLRLTTLPPLEAREVDRADGAVVHLVAKLEADAPEIRAQVHARLDGVAASPCD